MKEMWILMSFLESLIDMMIEEVKLHLITEVPEYQDLKDEEPTMMFIRNKVKNVVEHKMEK